MTPKLRSEQPEGWSCQQLSWGRVHAGHMWGEDEELNTGHTEIPVEIPRENGKEFEKEVLPIWLFNKYLLRTYLDFSAHVIASGNSKEKQSLMVRLSRERQTGSTSKGNTGWGKSYDWGLSGCSHTEEGHPSNAWEDFPREAMRGHIQKDEQGLFR